MIEVKTIGLMVMLSFGVVVSFAGLRGGAAGKPLMGLMPGATVEVLLFLVQEVAFVGAYEKSGVSLVGGTETVEVMVGVIVMVVWRLISPAAAGPARRAERKMRASIFPVW